MGRNSRPFGHIKYKMSGRWLSKAGEKTVAHPKRGKAIMGNTLTKQTVVWTEYLK